MLDDLFESEILVFVIDSQTINAHFFVLVQLLEVLEDFKRILFDTKHINLRALNEIIEKRHEVFLVVVEDRKNYQITSINFIKCSFNWTRFVWEFAFILITTHDSQKFLFKINLIKFISIDMFAKRLTFCSLRCFNQTCQIFSVFLLTILTTETNLIIVRLINKIDLTTCFCLLMLMLTNVANVVMIKFISVIIKLMLTRSFYNSEKHTFLSRFFAMMLFVFITNCFELYVIKNDEMFNCLKFIKFKKHFET